jgi:UDP-N-acetylmuramate: L-alanyl-gamma-D-glutamyl-meso-diaminopimelate ligase
MPLSKLESIHLMGICGTGMGSFAGLLQRAGYRVRGSDENVYPPMSDRLRAWGIPILTGYRAENLDPAPDLVVIGNVIKKTNPEAQAVFERNIPYTSFPKALGDFFLEQKHSIVACGTHGKTTTSSLIAWILTYAGLDPGMLIGGVPGNFGEGFRLGEGKYFVIEGDEYDTAFFDKVPKFLHYRPKTAVITSIEFDHADIYENVEAIEREFEKLVEIVPGTGKIIACATSPRAMRAIRNAKCDVETYTAREGARSTWHAREIQIDEKGSSFLIYRQNIRLGRFHLPLAGVHNVENAVAAIAVTSSADLSVADIKAALAEFKGVARRQTVRAEIGGVRIIDDFAHHPTAVHETISAVRAQYKQGRLFAIFEPRTATSSRKHFQDEYVNAFDGADEVIIASVGRAELPSDEKMDVSKLVSEMTARGLKARHIQAIDEIVAALANEARTQDSLLFMSNGAFGGIYEKMEAALRAR